MAPVPHPVAMMRAAVLWARAKGLRVGLWKRLDAFGVHCVSAHGDRWAPDPRDGVIDPIGAAILHAQPDTDDPIVAAYEALVATDTWIAGFVAGLYREDGDPAHASAADRRVYLAAYEQGLRYRSEILMLARVA